MRFGQFFWIHSFILIPILVLFYLWVFNNRKKLLQRFAQTELLPSLIPFSELKQRKIKIALMICVIFLCIFSLMMPQWGERSENIKRIGLDIIVAVDVSKSMLSEDIKPNRLERAKMSIKDLIKRLKNDRIGLIAFAGDSFLVCPLTSDYGGFLLTLDALDTNTIARPGTSISSSIKDAIRSYESISGPNKALVIISDGEDHEGNAVDAAEEAKKKGILISCIGVGTQEGDLIPVIDETGQKTFLKNREGNVVKSRADEGLLEKIALASGGVYVRSTSIEFGLNYIYDKKLSGLEKRELENKITKLYEHRFQLFLFPALIILLFI